MATVKSSSGWNASTINKFFNTILGISKNTEKLTNIETTISEVSTNTEGISEIEINTDVLAGSNGFMRYGTGTVSGVSHKVLVVQDAAEFSTFFVNGVDVLAARGMSGVTFPTGAFLPGGQDITGFTLTSGSVIAY